MSDEACEKLKAEVEELKQSNQAQTQKASNSSSGSGYGGPPADQNDKEAWDKWKFEKAVWAFKQQRDIIRASSPSVNANADRRCHGCKLVYFLLLSVSLFNFMFLML